MIGWARARLSIATCTAPIRARSKTKDAETAIRTLVKRGDPVTFQAVQREAGVSHSFLYTHPSLRERIEHLRHRNPVAPRPAPDIGTGESNLVLVLTAEVARLKKQLRDGDKTLRDALAQAHGENLELRRELTRRGWAGPSGQS
jgi:hypothetical protein